MSECEQRIRDSIIPDINVKFKSICLKDDENGVVLKTMPLDDFADFNQSEDSNSHQTFSLLSEYKILPIKMRKIWLYEQCRYG